MKREIDIKKLILMVASFSMVVGGVSAMPQALEESGVTGGLVVRIGCSDPARLVELRANDSMVVQGLDTDPDSVAAARTAISGQQLYGKISADTWDGKNLPYVDHLVNLLIADAGVQVPAAEIRRVLAPGGVAWIDGKKFVKPWPSNIDTWTHYLHDPGNNAVAHDTVVGPPRHMQWLGGPRWSRHHDHVASMNAMVSEKGKLFYIMDEGATASALTPSNWRLVARDAFNGIVLWKRDIPDWVPALWPLKSGPANLPRRLVAVGDTVYAPLGFTAPVAAMSAGSGETLRTYIGSDNTEEIIVSGDILLALTIEKQIIVAEPGPGQLMEADTKMVRDNRITKSPLINYFWNTVQSPRWFESERTVKAYQASTGTLLWESVPSKVMPLTMATDGERVYFHDGERIVALDRKTGKVAYLTEPVPVRGDRMYSNFGPTLVLNDGVIVFAGGEKTGRAWMGWESKDQGQDTMTAFDAGTGKKMWVAPHPYSGYQSPEDVLIAEGLVWAADTANGGAEGPWIGRDLHSGEVKREIPPTVDTKWFHHRCYRAKATDRFMMPSRNGIEYIDILEKDWDINHWVRSGCLYGIMPANGFTYTSPHNCACHPQAKLYGFNALAAECGELPPVANRLEKGPAFGKIGNQKSAIGNADWPMYRQNEQRSGSTSAPLGNQLTGKWAKQLASGKLTQAVVSGRLLITASPDEHTVFALDAQTGNLLWKHIAGGRIDSTPTIYNGMVVFGSCAGTVTCLRAADGELAWRFRAATADRRMTAFGQVESVWPVNGSVLVKDGEAFFTAGRSFFLDGGVHFYRLNVKTGEVVTKTLFDKNDYASDVELQAKGGLDMPVGLPDILGADGDTLFMRSQLMDKNGTRTRDTEDHLFAPYGFVDDAWFHRAYWVFGKNYMGGCGGYTKAGKIFPSGRMVVHDDDNVYVFGRQPNYYRWITEMDYCLFCSSRTPVAEESEPADDAGKKTKKKSTKAVAGSINLSWSHEIPMLVRAMGKAGDNLFMAGPPNFVKEAETVQLLPASDAKADLVAQDAAYRGEKGALLRVASARDGKTLAEYKLEELPAFDGISIASGSLYLVTETGKIICMQGHR